MAAAASAYRRARPWAGRARPRHKYGHVLSVSTARRPRAFTPVQRRTGLRGQEEGTGHTAHCELRVLPFPTERESPVSENAYISWERLLVFCEWVF